MKFSEMPVFGNMQGVRVIGTGTSIAGPVACSLFAEQGQAYSNVEGALGIFAGSAKRRFAFDPDTIPGMPVPSGMQVPPEIGRARHKSGF